MANISITVQKEFHLNRDSILFTISDNGPGMTKEVLEKAFLPLYTTGEENKDLPRFFGKIEFSAKVYGIKVYIGTRNRRECKGSALEIIRNQKGMWLFRIS